MVEAALGWLSVAALFILGLVTRLLLAVMVLAVVVLPIAGFVMAWRGAGQLADWLMGLRRLGHVAWRRGLYYTPGHMWLKPAGARTVRVGLDDVAQRVLPDITAVHLPMEGASVRQGDPLGRIQCASGAITLRAPIGGTIAAVNTRLQRLPALLHRDPYRRAWMVDVVPQDAGFREFATGEVARKWLALEDQRLTGFFERQLGLAAADGGELIVPPDQLLTPDQWESIRTGFLDAA